MIDCDGDWQKLGSVVRPLMLSRWRSTASPAAGKARVGYWLLSAWRGASFRQAIPGEQLSALIAPQKKDGEAVETNKLSTESLITAAVIKTHFYFSIFSLLIAVSAVAYSEAQNELMGSGLLGPHNTSLHLSVQKPLMHIWKCVSET